MASQKLTPEANGYVKQASKALARHRLYAGFYESIKSGVDSVELIVVRNKTPIQVTFDPAVAGIWSLHLSWAIRPVPRGTPILWQSTFGLSVRNLPFAPSDGPVCLVRYDVDNERVGPGLRPLGAHLNVLQPSPLDDRVHFPVLAGEGYVWQVGEVIDLFLDPYFTADLHARIGS